MVPTSEALGVGPGRRRSNLNQSRAGLSQLSATHVHKEDAGTPLSRRRAGTFTTRDPSSPRTRSPHRERSTRSPRRERSTRSPTRTRSFGRGTVLEDDQHRTLNKSPRNLSFSGPGPTVVRGNSLALTTGAVGVATHREELPKDKYFSTPSSTPEHPHFQAEHLHRSASKTSNGRKTPQRVHRNREMKEPRCQHSEHLEQTTEMIGYP